MNRRNKHTPRGQAALFDGIMFLLLASISTVMVYTSLSSYGVAQDQVLRSSYEIAYIESVGKAIYYIDANTLSGVALPSNPAVDFQDSDYCSIPGSQCSNSNGVGEPYWDLANSPMNCTLLANYPSQTVADLLKKDLGDAPDTGNVQADEANVCLDNHFGINSNESGPCSDTQAQLSSVPLVPGKLALRCSLMELMTPFSSAGFRYFTDILKETGGTVPQQSPALGDPGWQRITNSYVADANAFSACEDVQNDYTADITGKPNSQQVDLLTSAVPFRVPRTDNVEDFFAMTLRICLWNSQAS